MTIGRRKYRVNLKKSAIKDLDKLSDVVLKRVQKSILTLADNPRPDGCKKLKGRDDYRIRVGDYRILYFIEDDIVTVEVVRVQHRKDVYS